MTPIQNRIYKVPVDPKLFAALRKVKKSEGIPASEQVRRALAMWFEFRQPTTEKPQADVTA